MVHHQQRNGQLVHLRNARSRRRHTAVSSAYLKQIGGYIYSYDFAKVRLSPKNATGGTDLYSRNFAWGTSLFGLPGRAGLDAGFGISYNSLVWTKDPATNTVVFNADNSNLTPGFRFGFPTIEPVYYDATTEKFAYLMVTPSGGRAEFRQTTNSNIFETADSSYAELKINGTAGPNDPADQLTITVTGTDGTRADYEWKNGAYRCQKITDRNGNYIAISHDANGLLQTVTDTLGRVVSVNYNNEALPISVTQTWKTNNGADSDFTRTYATFSYTTKEINTQFGNSSTDVFPVIGPGNGFSLKVLDKVTFPTESNGTGPSTSFTYNSYGQVWKITNKAADGHQLNYTSVNLPADATSQQTDCPRFTETRNWAENFNLNSSGVEQETVVANSLTENASYNVNGHSGTATRIEVEMAGHPHGAVSKTWVGSSGWTEGLTIATEDWANSERKRWTWNQWTQDDTNVSYIVNPRVTASEVGDTSNRKLTEIDYRLIPNTTVAEYGLVSEVRVKDGATNFLHKKSTTAYNLDTAYVSRRILGLPSKTISWGYDQSTLQLEKVSEVDYFYDEGDFSDTSLEQNITNVIRHDSAYGASFTVGRGNLTSTKRYRVPDLNEYIQTEVKYNIAGAPVAQITPWTTSSTRTTKIGYADAFNDTSTTRNTYAFPTKLYDPAGNYSEVKYRFDTGANVWAKSPAPAGNSTGKETTREYDAVGRVERETIVNSSAYTRFEYPTNNIQSKVFTTVVDTNNNGADSVDEVLSESWTDGAGRVRRSRTPMTWDSNGATLTWSGVQTEYDILGQVKRQSVPSEVNSGWTLQNEDAARGGWLWNSAEYDWKGRPTRTIPTDSTGSDGKDRLIGYEGCGCAGGQVTTVESEEIKEYTGNYQIVSAGRRKQKIYEDILGRVFKTEVLNWNGSIYSTIRTDFNGRDQAVEIRHYQGADSSPTFQTTTMTYDGHGRMKTRYLPEDAANTGTVWEYNADDSIHTVTDPRGVVTALSHNNRALLTGITYTAPQHSNIPATASVSFSYDDLGNRIEMTDGTGSASYSYDELSRVASETKIFSGVAGSFTIGYSYHLGGQLKTVSDPGDGSKTVTYAYDRKGSLTAITGNAGTIVHNRKLRAFGGLKQEDYGDGVKLRNEFDNRLRMAEYDLRTAQNTQLSNTEFEYNAAGQVIRANGQYYFDRYYRYDHLGRMTSNTTKWVGGVDYAAYNQTVGYDVWSNMTSRSSSTWGYVTNVESTYQNDRNTQVSGWNSHSGSMPAQNWAYDASGNALETGGQTHRFDAANRKIESFEQTPGQPRAAILIRQSYDGDGETVRRFQQETFTSGAPAATRTEYSLRSSVLGGVIASVTPAGVREEEFVLDPASGMKKAKNGPVVTFYHEAPFTGSSLESSTSGVTPLKEIEPFGGEVPAVPPPNTTPDWIPMGNYSQTGNPLDAQGGCLEDGLPVDCSMMVRRVCVGNPRCMGGGINRGLGHILAGVRARGDFKGWRGLKMIEGKLWPIDIFVDSRADSRLLGIITYAGLADGFAPVFSSSFVTSHPQRQNASETPVPAPPESIYDKALRGISACISMFNKKGTRYTVAGFVATGTDSSGSVAVQEWLEDPRTNTFRSTTQSISNNPIAYNSVELAALGRQYQVSDKSWLAGLTIAKSPFSVKETYAASNLLSLKSTGLETGLENIVGRWIAVQVHELGVAMGVISNVSPDPVGVYVDKDDGMPFEECVFNALKGDK